MDEDALLERLESGALTAACFDVFAIEPAQMRQAAESSEHAGGAAHRRLDRGDAADHGARRASAGLDIARVVEPEEFYGV